jgi:putative DNA primase/helicase
MAIEWRRSQIGNPSPRIVATYDYRAEHGELLFQVCRFDPKDFRRPDENGEILNVRGTRQVPYRLPELIANPLCVTVFIPEGEKDVDSLMKADVAATCNPGGAASGAGAG